MQEKLRRLMRAKGVVVLACVAGMLLLGDVAFASGAKKINIQAKLNDAAGNPIVATDKLITLSLYDSEINGTLLWQETNSTLNISSGMFNVVIGTGIRVAVAGTYTEFDSIPFDQQYWLGIKVGSGPELTPRQALGSTPYALGSLSDFNVKKRLVMGSSGLATLDEGIVLGQASGQGYSRPIEMIGSPAGTNGWANRLLNMNGDFMLDSRQGTTTWNNRLFIRSADGCVGIGNNAPLGPLTVGNSSVDGSDGYIVLGKKVGGSNRHFRIGFDSNFNFVMGDYGYSNVAIAWASPFLMAWNAPSNSFAVNGYGNVGIGTGSPTTKLHVAQTVDTGERYAEPLFVHNPGTLGTQYRSGAGININEGVKLKAVVDNINVLDGGQALEIWTQAGGGNWYQRMKVGKLGHVMIGCDGPPRGALLSVAGWGDSLNGWGVWSDSRLKTDVTEISSGMLTKVISLKPIRYKLDKEKCKQAFSFSKKQRTVKDDKDASKTRIVEEEELPEGLDNTQIGLSAQDLERDFPELILKGRDDDSLKAVDYSRLSVVLLQAVKEQQAQIEALLVRINDLEKKGK